MIAQVLTLTLFAQLGVDPFAVETSGHDGSAHAMSIDALEPNMARRRLLVPSGVIVASLAGAFNHLAFDYWNRSKGQFGGRDEATVNGAREGAGLSIGLGDHLTLGTTLMLSHDDVLGTNVGDAGGTLTAGMQLGQRLELAVAVDTGVSYDDGYFLAGPVLRVQASSMVDVVVGGRVGVSGDTAQLSAFVRTTAGFDSGVFTSLDVNTGISQRMTAGAMGTVGYTFILDGILVDAAMYGSVGSALSGYGFSHGSVGAMVSASFVAF